MSDDHPPRALPWLALPEREVLSTPIFRVTSGRVESPTRPGVAFDAMRLRCPDWVNVVALTPERELVLVEQWRHGTRSVTLEIPGGVQDAGETPEEACARELLEETGHAGDPVRILGVTEPNPAFQDNRLHTGLVTNARRVRPPAGDLHEEIAVRLASLDEVRSLVRSGAVTHSLVVAALQLFDLRG